jgi:hypothetical protein
MPVCQVKKKFKDLQVGDILLVTKGGWGIHVFFSQYPLMFSQVEARYASHAQNPFWFTILCEV